MRALLVANPKASATTARSRDVLVSALSADLKVDAVETDHRGHAMELGVRATRDRFDVVVALGGDGTVNEVVNGLLYAGPGDHVPMLAVVPGGSANVFARALGLPDDPIEATGHILEALRARRSRTISLGRVQDRWFVFTAGLGFDAEVVSRVERHRAKDKRATPALYVRSAVSQFYRSELRRKPLMTLHIREEEPVEDLYLCIVTNTTPWTFVGPMAVQVTPEASFDQALDVFALKRTRTLATLRHLIQVTRRNPHPRGRKLTVRHDLTDFTLTSPTPLDLQVDGDYAGQTDRAHFSCAAAALRVIV